jgi:hypothetical protein
MYEESHAAVRDFCLQTKELLAAAASKPEATQLQSR